MVAGEGGRSTGVLLYYDCRAWCSQPGMADGAPETQNQNHKCIYSILIKSVYKVTMETILDHGTPIKTRLVANIRAAYYIIK